MKSNHVVFVVASLIVLGGCSADSLVGEEDIRFKAEQSPSADLRAAPSDANFSMMAGKGGKNGKVALCHVDQESGHVVRIEIGAKAAESHLRNHVGDGLIGTQTNPAAFIFYDDRCKPLETEPEVIFSYDFNALSSFVVGSQYNTGAPVFANGSLPGWTASGFHAVHGVEWQPGNRAATLYDTNMYTMVAGISANESGSTYQVDFLGSPSVWNNGAQATTAGDGIVFQVLRGNDTVLHTFTYFPTPWAGANNYQPAGFSYIGDGSGAVRIRMFDNDAVGDSFGGGVDDLTISKIN